MTAPEQSPKHKNSYILDTESATEMARLMLQDRLINAIVGGLFPEQENLDGIDSILDIGCGPGGWTLDVARSYPQKEITGIDISTTMLAHANEQKKIHGLTNINFKKMDVCQELQFPPQSFNLVNIRAATGYVSRKLWPLLLKECVRVTKPDGILRISESDRVALTNSPAFEKYAHYVTQLLSVMQYGFGADTYTFGMSPMLGKLLQDAGYHTINVKSYVLDFSYGTAFHPVQLQNMGISFQSLHPRLIEMELATQEELKHLHEMLIQEMSSETFCGIGYILTFWGRL
jgi:ubiquinone/menaquinone biosynthesis C-methylase UbiE